MNALVGKHQGKSMEQLVVKEPAYIHWLLAQSPTGGLLAMKNEAKRLIQIFDAKPYAVSCFNRCGRPATRFSVYGNGIAPMWWCAACDPYGQGANQGKLQILISYMQALSHVDFFCGGRTTDYRSLIKDMAQAKGVTRAGAAQLTALFA